MAYLFGKRFNDFVKEKGNVVYDGLGDILVKNIGAKETAAVAALSAAVGCTAVDQNRQEMYDACRTRNLESVFCDKDGKLKTDLSKEVQEGLINISSIKYIQDAMRTYHDGEKLNGRQVKALGLESTFGKDEIGVYSAALLQIEELRKKTMQKGEDCLEDARRGLLDSDKSLAAFDADKEIRGYRRAVAKKIFRDSFAITPLFTGMSIDEVYNDLSKHLVDKFPDCERALLEEDLATARAMAESGEIGPTIVDRVLRELYLVGARPFQRPKVLIAPFCEGLGPIPTKKSMSEDGIFWGGAYKLAGIAAFIQELKDEQAKHILGIGGRGGRTGGDDAGRGR